MKPIRYRDETFDERMRRIKREKMADRFVALISGLAIAACIGMLFFYEGLPSIRGYLR